MDPDKEPILKKESEEVIGAAFEVLNSMGYGLHEKPYENALVVEFRERGIAWSQQQKFPILYKGHHVGEYIPDLIAFEKIIVDTKVIDRITNHEIGQMMNYLKISGLRVGYILNFKHAKLQFKRIIR